MHASARASYGSTGKTSNQDSVISVEEMVDLVYYALEEKQFDQAAELANAYVPAGRLEFGIAFPIRLHKHHVSTVDDLKTTKAAKGGEIEKLPLSLAKFVTSYIELVGIREDHGDRLELEGNGRTYRAR